MTYLAARFRVVALAFLCFATCAWSAVGDLDPTFVSGTGTDGVVTAIVPLSSGQTLVAGLFTTYNGVARRGLVRLDANGNVDSTFAPNIEAPIQGGVATLFVDSSGRIYVGGIFTRIGGSDRNGLARLTANGSLDTSFVPELPVGASVASLALDASGSSLFVGGTLKAATSTGPGSLPGQSIQKLQTSSGRVDSTFTAPGTEAYDNLPIVYKILPLADGRILIAGEFMRVGGVDRLNLCRLRSDGGVDGTFTLDTPIVWTQVNDIDVDAGGRIYLSGDFIQLEDYNAGCIARLTPNGTIDQTFKFPATTNSTSDRAIVNNLLILSDGRLVAVGNFVSVNGTPARFITRIFDDGSIDSSFATGADQEIVALAEDSAGRLLIGGYFQTVNNTAAHNVARLLRQGDTPVVRSIPTAASVTAGQNLVLTPVIYGADTYQWYRDGKRIDGATGASLAIASANTNEAGQYTLVATGRFGSVTTSAIPVTVPAAEAGTVDTSFDAARAPFTLDAAITHLPDDTWVAAVNGNTPKLIRYDAQLKQTSSVDITGFRSFSATSAQANVNGQVWLTGTFTLQSSVTVQLVRLTAGGANDPAFNFTDLAPVKFTVLPDGSIISLMNGMEKYHPDGSRAIGLAADGACGFATLPDGRIVVGSWGYNMPSPLLDLVRLNADGTVDSTFVSPSVTGLGRRGLQWTMTELDDVAITSAGDIVATTKPLLNYAALVWMKSDGTVVSVTTLTTVEGQTAKIAAVDRENGVLVVCNGLLHCTSDGTVRTVLAGVQKTSDAWDSAATGLIVRYGTLVNSGPTIAWKYASLLDGKPGDFRLVNLSGRGIVGTGEAVLIVGFVTTGPNGRMLVRGVGPTLHDQGVSAPQEDLSIELHQGNRILDTNDDWAGELASVFRQVGAFDLRPASHDAALAPTLAGGIYSTVLAPIGTPNGVGLAEIYDASGGAVKLSNASIRGRVEGGEKVLIGGFVVSGSSPRWVLIRGIGPALASLGVSQPLSDPKITLVHAGATVADNDSWSAGGNGPLVEAAARKVGAFGLPDGSSDAALYQFIEPGIYSVVLSSADSSAGIALLEIYSLPDP